MRFRAMDDVVVDRGALKPRKGDVLLYQGDKYVALEVGLRYVRVYPLVGGRPEFPETIPVQYVTRTGESIDVQ